MATTCEREDYFVARKFDIIKKKDLPDEAGIVGFSFLKEPTEKDKEKKKYDFIKESNGNEIGCMRPKKKAFLAYTKGYVGIDNAPNVFVEVKSRLIIIIILIFALIAGLGAMFVPGSNGRPIIEDLPIIGDIDIFDEQQTRPTTPKDETEVPTITFAGYGKYTVTPDYPAVEVKNPEGNFVDMVFTLTDEATGEIIARTGKIPAGKFGYIDVMEFYKEAGVYTVLINVATYDAQSGAQMNGINQKMEVTVKIPEAE